MHPNIRYQQTIQYPNNFKFSYDQIKQSDRNLGQLMQNQDSKNIQYQTKNQQIISSQPILTRHKSNNMDMRFYQQSNFAKSYRLDSNPLSISNQQNNPYKTTTNICRTVQINKTAESANDFFNSLAAQSDKKEILQKKQQSSNYQSFQTINLNQQIINKSYEKKKKEQDESHSPLKFQKKAQQCKQCQQLSKQNQKIIHFMRQQIQIGVKQYSDRMNKIMVEQAKQIKDLRRNLINNQKNIIRLQKLNKNSQIVNNQRTLSPGKGQIKHKSPSKLSLTKSNTSISTNHGGKQKITMVSKELSPSKISIHHRNQQKQNISQDRLSSTIQQPFQANLNSQQVSRKVKNLEQKIQLLCKIEHERNEKTFFMNKKIQVLQKGVISMLSVRIQKAKKGLNQWIYTQQQKLNSLYKQIKLINTKIGTSPGGFINPSTKSGNPGCLKISQNSCYSTPSIQIPSYNKLDQSIDFNLNKISIKLKHFNSQIEDLKQIAINLKTKQYKYDHFQIDNLTKAIEQIHFKLYHLQKSKLQISTKLVSNDQKLQQIIQMSKFSQINSKIQSNPSQNNIQNKMKKININRNNSVDLSYAYKNSNLYQIGAKSMKNETLTNQSSKINKNIKNTSQNYSNFEPHSHSQFRGFSGEQSGFSQYVQESVYNQQEEYQEGNQNYEQSFERSSQNQQTQSVSQEQDQLFYHVELNNQQMNKKISQQEPYNTLSKKLVSTSTINRFMEVIQYRQGEPLRIQIDETGYIKSADNGMYIVDKNMDGFQLNRNELEWLKHKGIVILQY